MVDVVNRAEHNDLVARVAKLEAAATVPPVVSPPVVTLPPGDATGMQAVRAADFCGSFGFSAYPANNQDGGIPGQITPCIDYFTKGTGHRLIVRTYTWPGSAGTFIPLLQSLIAAAGCKVAPCIDHYNSSNDAGAVVGILNAIPAGDIFAVEGCNEPNMPQFGALSPAQVLASQQTLYAAAHAKGIKVIGPSALYSCADQVRWWGSLLPAALACMDMVNSHVYPNNQRYSGANQLNDWTDTSGLGGKDVAITEVNSALYNQQWQKDNFETWSGYAALCAWVNGYATRKVRAFIWFCLNDYANEFNPSINNG